jgi:hypothetical protein
MKKYLLTIPSIGMLLFTACESGENKNVIGKWQGVAIETPVGDSIIQERLKSLDTVTVMDSATMNYYKTTNIDSIKALIRADFAQQQEQDNMSKKEYAASLKYEIDANGKMYTHAASPMGNQSDTSVWYFADNGKKMVFDNAALAKDGMGDRMVIDIVKATKDSLSLKMIDPTGGPVIFHFKKDDGKSTEEK